MICSSKCPISLAASVHTFTNVETWHERYSMFTCFPYYVDSKQNVAASRYLQNVFPAAGSDTNTAVVCHACGLPFICFLFYFVDCFLMCCVLFYFLSFCALCITCIHLLIYHLYILAHVFALFTAEHVRALLVFQCLCFVVPFFVFTLFLNFLLH